MNKDDIKIIREKMNLTQLQFAESIGVDRRTIINYEKGNKIPKGRQNQIKHIIEQYDENQKTTNQKKTRLPAGENSFKSNNSNEINNQLAIKESLETKYITLLEKENERLKNIIVELEKRITQ